ncbi:response regulator [Candidatus Dependentiae bacterium]|nr:response regulator [Candidatus Dependentiae bacterium]
MKEYFILLSDDCPNSRTMMLNALSNFDKNYVVAKNPETAIEALEQLNSISLAIIDLHYDNSNLTGVDIIKKCAQKNIKCILITGDFIEDIKELSEIQQFGVQMLEKPINISIFKSTVSDILKTIK